MSYKLNLSDDVHRALKSYCKRNGYRMKTFVERLIRAEIENAVVEQTHHVRTELTRPRATAITGSPFWERGDGG